MTRWISGLACYLMAAVIAFGQDDANLPYVPGEILVKLRPGVKLAEDGGEVNAGLAGPGAVVEQFRSLNVVRIKLQDADDAGAKMQQAVATLSENPAVEFVQPNYRYYALETTPNDTKLDQLDFLETIDLPEAWDVRHDAPSIIVAVIDTGVMLKHEDIKGNLWKNPGEVAGNGADDDGNGFKDDVHGWDFFNDDNDPDADLVQNAVPTGFGCIELEGKHFEEHGTHVAGTIGAVGNNMKGISGVAWKVQIMPLKFLGGPCGSGSTADAIRAVDYAVDNGANVINCSWGGGLFDQLLRDALEGADQANVLVACAAGNDGTNNDLNPHFPSSYELPNIIAVAATDGNDQLAEFSQFGVNSVDLAAPGVEIFSTIPTGTSAPSKSGYDRLSGTSMATPVVAGVAALVRAEFPTLLDHEVRLWLMQQSDQIDELEGRVASGGRINARRALETPEFPNEVLAALPATAGQKLREQASPSSRVRAALGGRAGSTKLIKERLKLMNPQGDGPADSGDGQAEAGRDGQDEVEVLIQFNAKVGQAEIEDLVTKAGEFSVNSVKPVSEKRNVFQVRIKTSQNLKDIESSLKNVPEIRTVQPNYKYRQDKGR